MKTSINFILKTRPSIHERLSQKKNTGTTKLLKKPLKTLDSLFFRMMTLNADAASRSNIINRLRRAVSLMTGSGRW
jgi:hypothetical protein